ncbi:MAG: hypothetical protein IKE24_05745 [Clostridia bacterium]|nr:hypothetical protein [Clostridia bacterium]
MHVRYVIAGRPDLGEEYLAEYIEKQKTDPSRETDPQVRILRVLRYPRQHAYYWPDVAIEIPPVPEDTVCRLHILREANATEIHFYATYAASLLAAQEQAILDETNEQSKTIIRRQIRDHIFLRKRRI